MDRKGFWGVGEVGISRAGVAALAGGGPGGVWAASGHLRGPPGLLRTVGKWCPVWCYLEDCFHPPGGLGVRVPRVGNLYISGEGPTRGWCEPLDVLLVKTWMGRAPSRCRAPRR